MNKIIIGIGIALFVIILASIIFNQNSNKENKVVVYVAHDQDYSEPVLKEFEKRTGIKVEAVYDTETTKTTGLVNRLIAERDNPKADVFWNNEVSRTIVLKRMGILERYISPNSKDIPDIFKDPEGYWTGFAARARVLIYNTDLVKEDEVPESILDLKNEKWKNQVVIANPLFGTTASHIASLFAVLGDEKAKQFLLDLKKNGITIVEGNSFVRDAVANGEFKIGLTDTDDANDAIVDGKPVKYVFLDQGEGQIGNLIIPNTVMLIKNAPHKENGKKLIDFLLSKEVESMLAKSKAIQMPVRKMEVPDNVPKLWEIKWMNVTWDEIADKLETSQKFVREVFIR